MLTTANQCTQAEKRMAPRIREFAIAVVFAIRSACHACDSQETVIRALNCISCGSMLAYEVKLMRETIEKFALGIVFTAASASSIEWLIEHIYQKPAEVNDIASMPRTRMSTGFSVGGIRKRDVCPRDEAEASIVSARPVVMNSGWR